VEEFKPISKITLSDSEFEFLKDLVYKRVGIFLAPHKKILVQSRLSLRLRQNGLSTFDEYVQKLKVDFKFAKDEVPEIINRITTNKTDFFRENHHFEFIKNKLLPELEEKYKGQFNKTLRVWSSACSTGEEPYSIAITLLEYMETKPGWNMKIIASDVDTNVLQTAREGIYRSDRLDTVPEFLKQKYFERIDQEKNIISYKAKPILKGMIDFRQINLLNTPYPISESIDILFCRNVIIYFDKPTQKKIFAGFVEKLKDHSYMMIGHSETLFGISDDFKFLGHTIYKKKSPNP
jgi:chemotaxis protein methyltransferase CheR